MGNPDPTSAPVVKAGISTATNVTEEKPAAQVPAGAASAAAAQGGEDANEVPPNPDGPAVGMGDALFLAAGKGAACPGCITRRLSE